jgi:hypothetical protein
LTISKLRQGIIIGKVERGRAPDRLQRLIGWRISGVVDLMFRELIGLRGHHPVWRIELWSDVMPAVIRSFWDRRNHRVLAVTRFSP